MQAIITVQKPTVGTWHSLIYHSWLWLVQQCWKLETDMYWLETILHGWAWQKVKISSHSHHSSRTKLLMHYAIYDLAARLSQKEWENGNMKQTNAVYSSWLCKLNSPSSPSSSTSISGNMCMSESLLFMFYYNLQHAITVPQWHRKSILMQQMSFVGGFLSEVLQLLLGS